MRPYDQGESLTHLIRTAIPDFVEAEYPLFVEFLSAFLRFLESEREQKTQDASPEYGEAQGGTLEVTTKYGGPVYEARKLLEYRDVATTLDEFVKHFMEMYGKNFPKYSYVPADVLLQSLRQFYKAKGTVDSVRWFFRTFFNKHANVYFPREDVLRASDGTWRAPITLKVSSPLADPETGITPQNRDVATFYIGQRIVTDTGSAQVESVVTSIYGQAYNQQIVVNELTLKFDSILGTFEPNQIVRNIDSEKVVYTRILPVISGVIIGSGGSNYLPGDIVTFSEGPTGGQGYGAFGEVSDVASTSLNGVLVLDGGDGYVTGIPLTFVSSTGQGAAAVVSRIIYGELELEDGTGYLLLEDNSTIALEDRNTLTLELTIDPFTNEAANVALNSADFGAETGVAQMNGTTIDSAIEIALAATDEKPFMHPWVWTDALKTTAELANAAAIFQMHSNSVFFANGVNIYSLTGGTDLTTTKNTAVVTAKVIVSNTAVGNNRNQLFLKQFTNLANFTVGQTFKADVDGVVQDGTITTDGTTTVVGTNTAFTRVLTPNTHIRLDSGAQAVVRTVVNNTVFTAWSAVAAATANTWAIVPTGTVLSIDPQAQRYYGKIKEITFQSAGANYLTPPAVTAVSMSAEVQESFYYNDTPLYTALSLPKGTGNPGDPDGQTTLKRTFPLNDFTGDYTHLMWVRPRSSSEGWRPFYVLYGDVEGAYFYLWLGNNTFAGNDIGLWYDGGSGYQIIAPDFVFTPGEWILIGWRKQGTQLSLVINGNIYDTPTITLESEAVTNMEEFIGDRPILQYTIDTDVRYVRSFNRALSKAEIALEMASKSVVHTDSLVEDAPLPDANTLGNWVSTTAGLLETNLDANGPILAGDITPAAGQISVYKPASLQAQQDSGQVTRVKILNSGVNYIDANSIVINIMHGEGRTGSNASAFPILGALTHYPGEFTTTRGFLSSNKYLQDKDFYNNYTYVVRVAESFDRYRHLLLKLIHPAGFKAIGQFVESLTAPAPAGREAVDPVVVVTTP